jgi:hypothetical protein
VPKYLVLVVIWAPDGAEKPFVCHEYVAAGETQLDAWHSAKAEHNADPERAQHRVIYSTVTQPFSPERRQKVPSHVGHRRSFGIDADDLAGMHSGSEDYEQSQIPPPAGDISQAKQR